MLALNMNIFWTFFNLVVLYLLMRRFLFGPVNTFMEKRKKEINDSLAHAAQVNREAEALKKSYENTLLGAETEAYEILKNAKQNAVREYDNILLTAKNDAMQALRDADKAILLETQKAVKDVRREIVEVSLLAAERAAEISFDETANQKLIEEFIAQAGEGK